MRTLNDGTPIQIRCAVVWYDDGSRTACSVDEWPYLPSSGVVLVQVLYEKVHKGKYMQEVLHRFDYYWEFGGAYYTGRAREVPAEVPAERIKAGANVSDEEFTRQYNLAWEGVLAGPV